MFHRNIERKKDSEGNNITCGGKLKEIRAKSQRKKRVNANKGEKNKQSKINNGLYLLLLLWLSLTEKNNLIDLFLQHPVVSMFIPICLPIHNSKNIVSIAFLSQRHYIITIYTYLIDCWQFRFHPVVFIINHHPSVVVVTLYLLPTHHIKIVV